MGENKLMDLYLCDSKKIVLSVMVIKDKKHTKV